MSHVKTFMEQAAEDLRNVEYCCYCLEPKGDKISCCGELHFLPFCELDMDTQREIIESEYDLHRK